MPRLRKLRDGLSQRGDRYLDRHGSSGSIVDRTYFTAGRSFVAEANPHESTIGYDFLDWSAVAAAIPEDVDALVDGATACGAHELDARLRRAARAMQAIDW